jgi:hypothetical protein
MSSGSAEYISRTAIPHALYDIKHMTERLCRPPADIRRGVSQLPDLDIARCYLSWLRDTSKDTFGVVNFGFY